LRHSSSGIALISKPQSCFKKKNKLGCTYNLSYSGGGDRGIKGQHRQKLSRPYLKNKPKAKRQGHGPSGRALA
jgi:hypothetical protein